MDLAKTTARRHEKHLSFITIPSNGRLMLTSNEWRNTSSQTYIFPILTCYWHQFISTFLQSLLRKFQGMVVPYSSILVTSLRFSKVAFNNWNMQVIAMHRTRQIWGIWKLRPAYSPETPNLGQNRWCFVPCDLETWWMTLENNRASLLCCFKLCATFHSHRWIQTGVTVRKRPIWVKFKDF